MRFALLLPLAVLIAACSSDFGPASRAGTEQPVQLRIDASGSANGEPRTPTVASSSGEITVTGRLIASNPCQELSATAEWNEQGELVLTVTATAQNVICIQSLGGFSYTATVRNLAPGAYHLVVVHANVSAGQQRRTDTVLETSVVVP
jgi:hypothetical protein